MRPLTSLLLLLFTCFLTQAQEREVLLTNSQKIIEDRYEGIKGSPYAFKEWHPATIINTEAKAIEVTAINYNALTQDIEVKKASQFIALAPAWYVRIIIHVSDTEDIIFQRAFLTSLQNNFMQLVYEGDQVQLYKKIEKDISTKTFNDVGKTREVKRFVGQIRYYLVENEEVMNFKLNKKDFLKKIGNRKAVEGFLKKNKLKLNKEGDLIELMKFYDTLKE